MELSKDTERMIQDSISRAIASQMKIHSEAIEKKLADSLEIFTSRLDKINDKIDKMEKTQEMLNAKLNSHDAFINNIWKENAEVKKEHEELLKKVNEGKKKVEVAQAKVDDLEQYGRKTMLEINGFPRFADENPWKLTMNLAEKLDILLTEEDIEACHRISMNEKAGIIVEFASRKKRDELLNARRKLMNVSIKDFGYSNDGKIFVNESLTSKRKALIRDLKSKKDEYGFKYVWSKKGTIFIRRDENSRAIRITTIADLNNLNE